MHAFNYFHTNDIADLDATEAYFPDMLTKSIDLEILKSSFDPFKHEQTKCIR